MKRPITRGLMVGAGAVHISAVGVLAMMHQRWVVVGTISLAQITLILLGIAAGALASPAHEVHPLKGGIAGLFAALPLAVLAAIIEFLDPRQIFIALTPDLLKMLTFGLPFWTGILALLGAGIICGVVGNSLRAIPRVPRSAVIAGIVAVMIVGVFQELIQQMLPLYRADRRRAAVRLCVGGPDPGRCAGYLHYGCPGLASVVVHKGALWTAHRRSTAAAAHDARGPCFAWPRYPARSRRQLHRPGADAGRSLYPYGHGAEP